MNSFREYLPRENSSIYYRQTSDNKFTYIEEIIKFKKWVHISSNNPIELYKNYLILNNKKIKKDQEVQKTDVSKWSHLLMPVRIDKLYDDLLKC